MRLMIGSASFVLSFVMLLFLLAPMSGAQVFGFPGTVTTPITAIAWVGLIVFGFFVLWPRKRT